MILHLFFFTFSYLYHPSDWLHIPNTEKIVSITNSLTRVYIALPDGILVFERKGMKFVNSLTRSDLIPEGITIVAYDQFSGNLLITSEKEMTFFQPNTRIKSSLTLPFQPHSLGLTKDNICFLTKGEKYIWERGKRKFKKVKTFPDTFIFWYGANSPYQVKDHIFLAPYQVMDEDLNIYPMTIAFIEGRRLWVGVENYGILVYDLLKKTKIKEFRFGVKGEPVEIFFKREDGLWLLGRSLFVRIGSDLENWDYFFIRPNKFFSEKIPLLSFRFLDIFRSQRITSLWEGESLLFFASLDKLYFYDKEKEKIIKEVNLPAIQKICPIKETLFLLTPAGVFLYQLGKDEISELNDPNGDLKFGVYDMGRNNFGTIFAVRGGFLCLDKEKNWEKFIIPGIDLSLPIRTLATFGDYLFLGVKKEGLFVYNRTENRYFFISEKEGLLSKDIYSLYVDSTHLWIVTDKGVSRVAYRRLFE